MAEIKLNDKVVKTIQVNNNKKLITVVSQDMAIASRKGFAKFLNKVLGVEDEFVKKHLEANDKVVTISQPNKQDEFDPYIGVALALAYNLFGSKTKFRLSIFLAICVFLVVLGYIKDYDWDDGAFILRALGYILGGLVLIFLIALTATAVVENDRTNKVKVESWYNETVLNLNSTKEYIATITDDYVRSLAVKEYNNEVKSFKLQIKESKCNLDNGWVNWYTCSKYKELDENVVEYIR